MCIQNKFIHMPDIFLRNVCYTTVYRLSHITYFSKYLLSITMCKQKLAPSESGYFKGK